MQFNWNSSSDTEDKACLEIGVIMDWMKYGLRRECRHLHPVGRCCPGSMCRGSGVRLSGFKFEPCRCDFEPVTYPLFTFVFSPVKWGQRMVPILQGCNEDWIWSDMVCVKWCLTCTKGLMTLAAIIISSETMLCRTDSSPFCSDWNSALLPFNVCVLPNNSAHDTWAF